MAPYVKSLYIEVKETNGCTLRHRGLVKIATILYMTHPNAIALFVSDLADIEIAVGLLNFFHIAYG